MSMDYDPIARRLSREYDALSATSSLDSRPEQDHENGNGAENGEYLPLNGDQSEGFTELPSHGNSSFFQSLVNGVNVLAGIGILATPYATAGSGWLGLSLLFLFAVACCYTGLLLQQCMASGPRINSYPDIGEAAFGKVGRWVTACLLYVELYAVAVDLLILESDNLAHLFPHISIFGVELDAGLFFLVLSALVVLPTVWLRDLSLLATISTVGVLSTLVVVLSVAWIGAFGGVGFTHTGQLLIPTGLPAAAGLFGFCFSGHAVIPNIYTSMRKPSLFMPVLVISFAICFVMYCGIAVCGYLMYGDGLKDQITLNLPSGLPATQIAVWTTVLTPFTKYALTITPLALSLEEAFGVVGHNVGWRGVFLGTAIRTLLVFSAVAVAAFLPYFELVVAFTGSFLSLSISVILPCVFAWKLIPYSPLSHPAFLLAVLVLGIVSAVAGTYYSLKGIAEKFHGGPQYGTS